MYKPFSGLGYQHTRTKLARNVRAYTRLIVILPIIMVTTFFSLTVSAQDVTQTQLFQSGILYFDSNSGLGGSCGYSSVTTTPVAASQNMDQNAQIIIGIAKTDNVGQAGALIGLMVGLAESQLTNDANQNVPLSEQNPNKQGDGNNGTSLGVFQQQITENWSTISTDINNTDAINQLMTPSYASEAFFGGGGPNSSSALSKGLLNIPNWQSLPPEVVAQQVQNPGPANSGNLAYQVGVKAEEAKATSLLNQYWTSSPPITLPVPLTGGIIGTGGNLVVCSNACSNSGVTGSSNTTQLRQTIVCVANQELNSWLSKQLTPGTSFDKYSQQRNENWCADFASWVYAQSGDPLINTNNGIVPSVSNIEQIGQAGQGFIWHSIDSGYAPQPGDLAIHGNAHVNIVGAVNGATLTIIGGNQGGSSPNTSSVSEYSTSSPSTDDPPITGYVSPN